MDSSEKNNEELLVTVTMRELLCCVDSYTSKNIIIEPELVPFTLDYIPAIGEVDSFIKIPRPDEIKDSLGLATLDEPAIEQTDPAILNMHLRNKAKDLFNSDTPVKKLERADKKTVEIDQWINNIKSLHSKKPSDIVHYSNPMPDIERLMQEWPPPIEDLLRTRSLPSASLDATLEQYIDICLALFDIPVRKSRIQSLHVLFTLFYEFHSSQHFRNLAENNLINNVTNAKITDRLEL